MDNRYNILRLILSETSYRMSLEPAIDCRSVDEMLSNTFSQSVVVIDGFDSDKRTDMSALFQAVSDLRNTPAFCYAPIYFSHTAGELDNIADGVARSMTEKLPDALPILERGRLVGTKKLAESSELRFLAFMYARGEGYLLKPTRMPFTPWVYAYLPAAVMVSFDRKATEDLFMRGKMNINEMGSHEPEIKTSSKFLKSLQRDGFLNQTALVDRVRFCPKCQTGHMNFIDLCPNCDSIDFDKTLMLHCFTCGHVAPEEAFVHNMTLVCPKCRTQLRHIGSDYDHPLESYECNSCSSRFIDPHVVAECMSCGTRSETDALTVNNIYSYVLSEKGVAVVKRGILTQDIAIFDGMNNMSYSYFCRSVEWLSQLKKRYTEDDFTLICVKFAGVYDIEAYLGYERFNEFMQNLSSRMRDMIRTTDVTTSASYDTFWILLPRTPKDSSALIAERMEGIANLIAIPGAPRIIIRAGSFTISGDMADAPVTAMLEAFAKTLVY